MHGIDLARGDEPGAPAITRITSPKDDALARARAAGLAVLEGRYSVHKYDAASGRLTEVVELPPNLFLTAGITKLWNLVAGVSSTHLDATNTRLAVGDSSTAAAAGQTDLLGTNKFRKLVSGAPVISNNQITFSAQFETGEANFAWLEVGVGDSGTAGAQLISRTAITSPGLGTKVNTAVWVLNWTLSIS